MGLITLNKHFYPIPPNWHIYYSELLEGQDFHFQPRWGNTGTRIPLLPATAATRSKRNMNHNFPRHWHRTRKDRKMVNKGDEPYGLPTLLPRKGFQVQPGQGNIGRAQWVPWVEKELRDWGGQGSSSSLDKVTRESCRERTLRVCRGTPWVFSWELTSACMWGN